MLPLRILIICFFISIAVPPTLRTSAAEAKYEFTTDWVTPNVNVWTEQLKHLKGESNIHALEIGSFEGRSAIWFLENILTHPTSSITCVDIFFRKTLEDQFDRNTQASGLANKVRKIKGSSQKVLRELEWNSYNFIYIDGSHVAKDVLLDAVLTWDLLKVGGIIIFDDYQWKIDRYPPWRRPQIAIDAFLQVFGPYIEVLHKEYQVVVRKKDKVILEVKVGILQKSLNKIKKSLNKINRFAKTWRPGGADRVGSDY